MDLKQVVEISKCLSNPARVEIMEWLKDPEANFPPNETGIPNNEGVCLSYIQQKSGLSQSTISGYLQSMERCGLINVFRAGRWSYFSRNNATLTAYMDYLR